jgi:hypothetical protein
MYLVVQTTDFLTCGKVRKKMAVLLADDDRTHSALANINHSRLLAIVGASVLLGFIISFVVAFTI